jgi:hypothetical protein
MLAVRDAIQYSRGSGAGMVARQVKVDSTLLMRRLDGLRKSLPEISGVAALEGNALIAGRVAETSRRDTNRFVRGWLIAMKMVGPIPAMVPGVQASSRHADYVLKLILERNAVKRELVSVESAIDWWFRNNPTRQNSPYYRKMLARRNKLLFWKERLEEEVRLATKYDDLIFMDAERGKRNFSTVRVKIFGGRGRMVRNGNFMLVRYHNLEAHTTIVERRDKILARALGEMKTVGAQRMKAAGVRAMRARWGAA